MILRAWILKHIFHCRIYVVYCTNKGRKRYTKILKYWAIFRRLQHFTYIYLQHILLLFTRERIFQPLSFFHIDLTCFFYWRRSLPLTRRPYIRRLFLFFLPTISVFVLFSQNWSELAFGSHHPLFELLMLRNLENYPVSLNIYASLLIKNRKSVLNIKGWRNCILKKVRTSYLRWNPR